MRERETAYLDVGLNSLSFHKRCVVGHGLDYVEMAGRRGGQVAADVTESNQGVAKEMEGFPHHVEKILVLLPLPGLRTKKQENSFMCTADID